MKLTVMMVVLLLAGCASVPSVGELGRQGFRLVNEASGPHHQLWAKETWNGTRRERLCVVPTVQTQEYYWRIRLLLKEKVVWTDNNVVRSFRSGAQVECVTSGPLPEGRLVYWMSFQYKETEGERQPAFLQGGLGQARKEETSVVSRPETAREIRSSVNVPTWNRGDEWRFRWSSPRGSGTFVWTIAGEDMVGGVAYYIMQSGSRQIYYSKAELAWLMDRVEGAVETRASPAVRGFAWPLEYGNEWEEKYFWESPGERRTEDRLRRFKVEALEPVTVPAGTFQTFLLTVKDPTGRLLQEYWYSPEVKWWVKERTYFSYGVRERELLEYKLTPIVSPPPAQGLGR